MRSTEAQPPLNISHEPSNTPIVPTQPHIESPLSDRSRAKDLVKRVGMKLAQAFLPFAVAFGGSTQPIHGQEQIYVPKPGISGPADPGVTSEGMGIRVPQRAQSVQTETLASTERQSVAKTWEKTAVSQEWLRENHPDVRFTADIKNANKEVTNVFAMKGDGTVYHTFYNTTTKQYEEFAPVSPNKVPIEDPHTLSAASNGVMLAGGLNQSVTTLAVSFDTGGKWEPVAYNFGELGPIRSILPIGDMPNKYLITARANPNRVGMFIATVDPQSKTVTIQETDIKGSARELSIMNVDATTNKMNMVGTGTEIGKPGLLLYSLDLQTGKGTVEQLFREAGDLFGRAEYKDENGDTHILSSNVDWGLMYDFNISKRTIVQQIPYGDISDDQGFPDNIPGRTLPWGLETYIDPTDNKRKVAFGGHRSTTRAGRVVLGVFTLGESPRGTVKVVDIDPQVQSGMWEQRDFMLRKTPDGNLIVLANIRGDLSGLIVYDVTKGKYFVRSDKGLDKKADDPASVRPVRLHTGATVHIPVVQKKAS